VQLKKTLGPAPARIPRRPGIILNRWGRAYLTPPPGFFFGQDGKPAPPGSPAGSPFGRIAFAKTDLSGVADHRSSIIEANRVVGQLLVLS
jgi:spermidine dehydrogenase